MSRNVDLPPASLSVYLVAALVLLIVGGVGGYWIGAARVPVAEDTAPAAEVRQADGSLVLARIPDAAPPPAPHAVPRGTKELRRTTAKVQPAKPDCPPVTITSSLVQDGDGLRTITSADTGIVVEGSDLVIRPLLLPAPVRRWAAGVAYEPFQGRYGAWAERDVGRLRIGAELRAPGHGDDLGLWLRAGLSF